MSQWLKLWIVLFSTSAFVYAADEEGPEKSQWVQKRDATVAVVEREVARIGDQAADAAPVIARETNRVAEQISRETNRIGKQVGRLFGRR